MNITDYAKGYGGFLFSLSSDVQRAWDEGRMVPCEACDDGGVYIMLGNQCRVETCRECDGTGYVMEAANDK